MNCAQLIISNYLQGHLGHWTVHCMGHNHMMLYQEYQLGRLAGKYVDGPISKIQIQILGKDNLDNCMGHHHIYMI